MRVVICDDDLIFINKLEQKLQNYSCNIDKFCDAKSLQDKNKSYDIAFLDIELSPESLGFDIVRYLKINNAECIIVFFTNHSKYAIQGYEYGAFRYILKNEPDVLINRRIAEVFKEFSRRHKILTGSYKDKTFAIRIDEIYYVEVFNHTLKIHTKRGEFELYKQIKEIYSEIQQFDFLRCHRSYIVNLRYVVALKSDGFFMLKIPNEVLIPIGIRYRTEVKDYYLNYAMQGVK